MSAVLWITSSVFFWNIPLDGSYLAYQGCYIDDPQNPDFPRVQNLPSGSKPSECLEACEKDEFQFASVQMVRIGWQFYDWIVSL